MRQTLLNNHQDSQQVTRSSKDEKRGTNEAHEQDKSNHLRIRTSLMTGDIYFDDL